MGEYLAENTQACPFCDYVATSIPASSKRCRLKRCVTVYRAKHINIGHAPTAALPTRNQCSKEAAAGNAFRNRLSRAACQVETKAVVTGAVAAGSAPAGPLDAFVHSWRSSNGRSFFESQCPWRATAGHRTKQRLGQVYGRPTIA